MADDATETKNVETGTEEKTIEYYKAQLEAEKAYSSKWENRSKDNFAELEALKAKATEKATKDSTPDDKLSALEARLAAFEKAEIERGIQEARGRIAAQHNLPDFLASRVKGKTPEEIEEDAKALFEAYSKSKVSPLKPSNRQGGQATGGEPIATGTLKSKEDVIERIRQLKGK